MPRLVRSAVGWVLLWFLAGALADTPPPKRIAWTGATVYDATGRPGGTDKTIVTRGERIEALVPAADFHPGSDMTIVDLHGKFVIPGLINTHVHLATSAVPDAARGYLRREVDSGVTAVLDQDPLRDVHAFGSASTTVKHGRAYRRADPPAAASSAR